MKKFYLIPNLKKNDAESISDEICAYVEEKGGSCVVTESKRLENGAYEFGEELTEDIDAIITLGGDGTIIQAADSLHLKNVPLLGINLGTLGFLAEMDKENWKVAIDALLSDDFYTEERMMLSATVKRGETVLFERVALNDIVLHASGTHRTTHFEFLVNDEHIRSYFGDGMIIATPTGSTAYSLSCGGPIVMPSAEIILATPINPHSLISRSIALPGEVKVTLKVTGERDVAVLNSDSVQFQDLKPNDEVIIKKSDRKVKLIRLHKDSFIDILRTKLEN